MSKLSKDVPEHVTAQLTSVPSHLRVLVNTTVLAGMFIPMLNVSVAKRALINPSEKRISTISFRIGRLRPMRSKKDPKR